MTKSFSICLLLLGLLANAAHAAAPSQLLNRTIISSFTVTTPATEDGGKHVVASRTAQRRIYVSSAGRIFERHIAFGRKHRKESERDPTATRLHFAGAKLQAFLPRVEGVTLIEYSFDASFRTCDVQVINGREGQPRKWRALSGRIRTATGPTTLSNASCSIVDGNQL